MGAHHHRMQRAMRHVLADAGSGSVVNSDENHGLNDAFADQAITGFVDLPFDSVEGSRPFEDILTII